MIKKSIKLMAWLLMLLLVLGVALGVFVLYSQSGSRLAINQAIKFAEVDVRYDSIEGNLAHGLRINNFKYSDQSIDVSAEFLSYKSNWSWFNRHVELAEVSVKMVDVVLKETAQPATASSPFTGLTLPLSIDLQGLTINQLTIKSGTTTEHIDSVVLLADIQTEQAIINDLQINAATYGLQMAGDIAYGEGLSYDLTTQWQAQLEEQQVNGQGGLQGDLNQLQISHDLLLDSELLSGQFKLNGSVTALQQTPSLAVTFASSSAVLAFNQQTINFENLEAQINGHLNAYHITLDSAVKQTDLPTSQITLRAQGDSQQLSTEKFQVKTSEGAIELSVVMSWQDQFALNSQVVVKNFNPQQILNDWPGMINGQLQLAINVNEHDELSIDASNNLITGQLKGEPFKLMGAAHYSKNTLATDKLILLLGENQIIINGEVSPTAVTLTADLVWPDLSVLDQELSGELHGSIHISGDHLKPQIDAQIRAQALHYLDYRVAELVLNSQGQWQQSVKTEITATNASWGEKQISSVTVKQSGWLDKHQVDVQLEMPDLSSFFSLTGQFQAASQAAGMPPTKAQWQGQLKTHELIIESGKKIKLQAPIAIMIAEQISIEPGCWQGVEAGTLCLNLNDISQDKAHYQGSFTVESFSLIPLQIFLPDQLEIKGKLSGKAEFELQQNKFNIDSNISLNEGEMTLRSADQITYQTAIELLAVKASTNNQQVVLSIESKLADQSYIQLQGKLNHLPNQPTAADQQALTPLQSQLQAWQIEASVDGVFNGTELITELTDEVKEMQGQLKITGTIVGDLLKPDIDVAFSQPAGYLTLTRLGTIIEQLNISINTEGLRQPVYLIQLSGRNVADVNQGNFSSQGKLTLSKQQWEYSGDLKGDNFMLMNLPEIKFNVSPDLQVTANQLTTHISGDVLIDYGHVIIKQLPPSTISNSADMEIHSTEAVERVDYPVTLNINAKIKEHIKLDVIGLNAELTGDIQLNQGLDRNIKGVGVLNLNDGSYEIYGQKLDITAGELTFTGPLDNPRLNVKASRKSNSGEVVAGVNLGGTVNNLQSDLYSEPSLSDLEILAYIMTGQGLEGSGNLTGQQLQQAAIVMGLNKSSPLFNQIQSQFGIDVLTIKEAATAADTVIEAGKKINDKLYVSYNQGLFNRVGFWVLKYRLNQYLNLQTTQGDDQSIELVYTRKADNKPKIKKQQ